MDDLFEKKSSCVEFLNPIMIMFRQTHRALGRIHVYGHLMEWIAPLCAVECLFAYLCGCDDAECECPFDGRCMCVSVCYVVFLVE